MVTRAPSKTILPMIGAKMPAFVDTLISRKWTDAEITEDLEFLKGVLGNSVQGLTYVLLVGAFADLF